MIEQALVVLEGVDQRLRFFLLGVASFVVLQALWSLIALILSRQTLREAKDFVVKLYRDDDSIHLKDRRMDALGFTTRRNQSVQIRPVGAGVENARPGKAVVRRLGVRYRGSLTDDEIHISKHALEELFGTDEFKSGDQITLRLRITTLKGFAAFRRWDRQRLRAELRDSNRRRGRCRRRRHILARRLCVSRSVRAGEERRRDCDQLRHKQQRREGLWLGRSRVE